LNSDLFVISAPSGTGKTTLIRKLLGGLTGIDFSVSFTTRSRREGEREGTDYHFVSAYEFDRMVEGGEFLEWAQVYGHRYGTSAKHVDKSLSSGRDVLLDIDTQGAASVRKSRREATLIFILPPDRATLERRLRGRGVDSPEEVARRLEAARAELERYTMYDYIVVNDSIEEALKKLEAIVLAHRCRRSRQEESCRGIVAGFTGA